MALAVCEYEGRKAGEADSLAEKQCVEVETLFCGGDDVLEWGLRKHRTAEEGDEPVGFTLAEGRSARRDAAEKLFEVEEGSGV